MNSYELEIIGFIVSSINLIAISIIIKCHKTSNSCAELEEKLKTNFKWAYKEFGNSIPTDSINKPDFKSAINRIYELHATIWEISGVKKSTKWIKWLAPLGLMIAIAPQLVIYCIQNPNYWVVLFVRVGIPFIILSFQFYMYNRSNECENAVCRIQANLDQELASYDSLSI